MSDKFELPEGYTGTIQARPGYDHRDDLSDKRGCHGMSLIFILRTPDGGALTWELMTGWMVRPVRDWGWSIYSNRPPQRGDKPGIDVTGPNPPYANLRAGRVDLHHAQRIKDWWSGPQSGCLLVEGGVCYGDSGYLIGDQVLAALMADGDPGVWREMVSIYEAWTGPDEEAS